MALRRDAFLPLALGSEDEEGHPQQAGPSRFDCLRVKLDRGKASKDVTKTKSDKSSDDHTPKLLFQLFLLCASFAAFLCGLQLKYDVLALFMQRWQYLLALAVAGLLTLLAGMASPRFSAKRSTQQSLKDSIGKIKVLAMFLFPVFVFYGDLVSDILMIHRFWLAGKPTYAILNTMAIIAGSFSSVVNGVHDFSRESLLLTVMIFLQLTPLAITVQSFGLFIAAVDSSGTDPRYKSLEGYLRDEGCERLLARAIVGEAFTEALLSTFLQSYALLQHTISWNRLTIVSLAFSIGSISKSFAKLDKHGHVSRDIDGQAIVVGLADWSSLPFILVVVYRLTEVISQVLFFPLFQMIRDSHGIFFGKRCSGVLLWLLDVLVQAALVRYSTGNNKKLHFAVPNTIGAFEPMLLAGSDAMLSTNAGRQALIRVLELTAAIGCLCLFSLDRVQVAVEEHPQIFLCFGLCNVAKYLLFCLLRNVCAVQTTDLDEFSIGMVLTEKAMNQADAADRRVPLRVAAVAGFSTKGGADPKKLFNIITDAKMSESCFQDMAGQVCHLISRLAQHSDVKKKEELLERGAGLVVLEAMRRYVDVDTSDCPVLRGATRAVMNLATQSANNKGFFAEHFPEMLLKSMKKNDNNLRKYACFALEVLVGDPELGDQLAKYDFAQPVLDNFEDKHREDSLLQTASCGLIAKLARNDEIRKQMAGHAEKVVDSMCKHFNDVDVQRHACHALRRLAPRSDPDAQSKLWRLGVRDAVLKALDYHAGQPAFQYEAWQLLQSLDQENPSTKEGP